MPLSVRPDPYVVPSYSLTGDLLAYLRCGLQYRYFNRGSLPPSKPVQLWFGQFIHGVLEEAYRKWRSGSEPDLPWMDSQMQPIVDLIIRRLSARGLSFQRYRLLGIAVERAFEFVNVWGPYLFPLISEAEVRLQGIRPMPTARTIRQGESYEVEGIVDVITSVELSAATSPNPIVGALLSSIATQAYEVVVDYKGMRRPSIHDPEDPSGGLWQHQEWQVLTYAWLRAQQPDAQRVKSGVLLYINELVPGVEDMDRLHEEVFGSGPHTDLPPTGGDLQTLREWPRSKSRWSTQLESWSDDVRDWWLTIGAGQQRDFPRMPAMPEPLSMEYRLGRCLRTVEVADETIQESLDEFDGVVARIEESVAEESDGERITESWDANPREETCTVCDFRTFCPSSVYRGAPRAP